MGDIADDTIDAGFAQMWEDEEQFDDFDDKPYYRRSSSFKHIPFVSIVTESPKAWKIEFLNDKVGWIPKSKCSINIEEKIVTIPDWLFNKMKKTSNVNNVVKKSEFEYDANRDKLIVVIGNCEGILKPDWTDVDIYYSKYTMRQIARDFENSMSGILATKNLTLLNYFSKEFAKNAFFEVIDGKLLKYFRNDSRIIKLDRCQMNEIIFNDYISF